MKQIQNFDVKQVPFSGILFAVTSEPDYGMDRLLIIEDYPEYANYLILDGGHCSCYGFDETEWDATIVSKEEFLKLIECWNDGLEAKLKPLIKEYLKAE